MALRDEITTAVAVAAQKILTATDPYAEYHEWAAKLDRITLATASALATDDAFYARVEALADLGDIVTAVLDKALAVVKDAGFMAMIAG